MAETWIDNLPHFMTTEAGRSAAQKAIAERDELLLKLETSQVALKGAEERAKMLLDAKSHWAERARTAESRLGALQKAIEADLSDAKAVCGGDGEGCETYRGYYDSAERRHRKCGQCPMDAIFHARRALASLDVAVLKGDRFTGTDCDFYEPGNGDACMNCGTTHESPAVERPAP